MCVNTTYYFEAHETISISTISWICIFGTPMVVMIGIFGNSVSFMVFQKRALRSSSHFYFCSLVVADSLTLLFGFLIEAWLREYVKEGVLKTAFVRFNEAKLESNGSAFIDDYIPHAVRIGSYSYLCLPSVFLKTTAQTASVYLLLTFTATRTLVIVYPLQSAIWATVSTAKKCVSAVVVCSVLIATCTTAYYHAFAKLCDPLVASDVVDLIFLSFVPSITLLIFNCVIMCTIYRRERLAISGLNLAISNGFSKNDCDGKSRPKLHVGGITKRLIIVTIAFTLLEMPLSVCKVYIHLNDLECLPDGSFYKDLERALRLLSNINYSVNFLLYCISGEQFRRALLYTMRCRQPSFSLIRRMNRKPVSPLTNIPRKRLVRPRSFGNSVIIRTIVVTRDLRNGTPFKTNSDKICDEMELELTVDRGDIEYFDNAVKTELQVLQNAQIRPLRAKSVPSFMKLNVDFIYNQPQHRCKHDRSQQNSSSQTKPVDAKRKRSCSLTHDPTSCSSNWNAEHNCRPRTVLL